MIFFSRLIFRFKFCRSFSCKMSDKFYNTNDLQEMTRDQLINKAMHFQNLYRQVVNKLNEETKADRKLTFSRGRKRRKGVRAIDFKSCLYRRIALKFAYLGWNYKGLQAQTNVDDTVEELLRRAIRQSRLAADDDPLRLSRCGRTDKGVSAFEQVVTVRLRTRLTSGPGLTKWIDPSTLTIDDRLRVIDSDDEIVEDFGFEHQLQEPSSIQPSINIESPTVSPKDCSPGESEKEVEFDYVTMLNRILPPEIKITAWAPVVDETFSARHDCVGREYRYYFTRGNLDIKLMNGAAQLYCGEHDFRNFGKLNVSSTLKFVRKIYEFDISELSAKTNRAEPYDMCCARIKGSGFIYHQVRNMMAVLCLIGAGREDPSVITELLDVEKNARKPEYGLIDGYPLVLYQSNYENIYWRISDEARKFLLRHFHRYWNESVTKSTIVCELIKSIKNCNYMNQDVETDEASHELDFAVHDVHSNFAISGFKHSRKKRYKKLLDLPRGPTVEEKLEALDAKRKRLGMDQEQLESSVH